MNYLYNGVELPALPEWDKGTYPYAVITECATIPASGATHMLYVTSKKLFAETDGECTNGAGHVYRYIPGNAEWTYLSEVNIVNGATTTNGEAIWCNGDIYYKDSTLYLAASDPIPVTTIDPTSLMQGYLVGCAIRANRGKVVTPDVPDEPDEPVGEIVAYLYNGVQLPPLPTAKTGQDYFYIYRQGEDICLYASPVKSAWNGNNTHSFSKQTPYIDMYVLSDGAWELKSEGIFTSTLPLDTYPFIWANYDIVSYTGNGYFFQTTDPVPVYA